MKEQENDRELERGKKSAVIHRDLKTKSCFSVFTAMLAYFLTKNHPCFSSLSQ